MTKTIKTSRERGHSKEVNPPHDTSVAQQGFQAISVNTFRDEIYFGEKTNLTLPYKIVSYNVKDPAYLESNNDIMSSFRKKIAKPDRDKNFECTICNDRFAQKQTLKQHVLTHTGHRPYECTVCQKSFTQAGSLDRHMRLHYDVAKPYACHLCPLTFRQPNNLKRHVRLHENAPMYQCDVCYRRFARKEGLFRHAKTHLSKHEKHYCQSCDKVFADAACLVRHVKWLHREEVFSNALTCCKCNLELSRKEFHSVDTRRDVVCNKCQKKSQCDFTTSNLCQNAKYQRLHSEKHRFIYVCSYCSDMFMFEASLQDHIDRVHVQVPHKCKLCPESFAKESSLTKHYLRHRYDVPDLNEYVRVYQCHYCDQLVTSRSRIIRHVRKHEDVCQLKVVEIVGGSAHDEGIKETRSTLVPEKHERSTICNETNTSKNSRNQYVQESKNINSSKSPPVLPEVLKNLLKSIGANSDKNTVEIQQPKKVVMIETNYDNNVNSKIFSEILTESPSETDSKNNNTNIVYNNNESVAIIYKDCVTKDKQSTEDQITIHKEIMEFSLGRLKEEICTELECDIDQKLDDSKEEIYSQGLINRETSICEDNIKIEYANQELTDELSGEIKIQEQHVEEYDLDRELNVSKDKIHDRYDVVEISLFSRESSMYEDNESVEYPDQRLTNDLSREIKTQDHVEENVEVLELNNSREEIDDRYDTVETSSFLLEERTTSAPNSPQVIDDFDLFETFDSEPPTQGEVVAKNPKSKNLQISLDTIKNFIRHSSKASCNNIMSEKVDMDVPQRNSQELVKTQDATQIEYVKVLPDMDEQVFYDIPTMHKEGKYFFCYVCKKKYTSRNSLKRHFRVTHMEYKKEQCSLCSKTFQTADALRKHVRALHAPHRFLCSVCKRTFNRKDALASHQRLHSGDKPFACQTCGECFAQKQNLHAHSMKHLKEKPFTCDVCGKGFCAKTSMRRHVLIHTGERKFSCDICEKAFQQKVHLDNHLTVHGIIDHSRLFICRFCDRVFSRKESLLRHLLLVHNKGGKNRQLFYCNHCNKGLKNKNSLQSHLLRKVCRKRDESEKTMNRKLPNLPNR